MNHEESRDSIDFLKNHNDTQDSNQHLLRKDTKNRNINNSSISPNDKRNDMNDINFKGSLWGSEKLMKNKSKTFTNDNESTSLIVIRILILFLICIYIPLQTFFSPKFDSFEDDWIFPQIIKLIPEKVASNPFFIFVTDYFTFIFSSRDLVMIYIGIIYVVCHPFIAVKIIFVTHFFQFFIVILRCLFQSHRPIWLNNYNTITNFCSINFANPSEHFFFITFFYPYLLLSVSLVDKQNKRRNAWKKLLYFFIYLLMVLTLGFLMVLKRFNYIYQLNFAFTFAIISLSAVIDLENYIHNFVLNSMKNVIKIRKYKIKFFIIILVMNIAAVIMFNFIEQDPVELIEANKILKKNCSNSQLSNIGLKSTFLDITYIFGILGTYLGTSLTVEKNCGQWWGLSKKNLAIKILITSLFGIAYLYLFNFIYTSSFEFNYFVNSIKYLLFYFIMMGYIPLLFQKLKLNKNPRPLMKSKSLLFSSSILSYKKGGDFRSTQNPLQETRMKNNLYSQSILVGGVDPKTKDDRLEFLLNKQTYNQDDDKQKFDETMGTFNDQ